MTNKRQRNPKGKIKNGQSRDTRQYWVQDTERTQYKQIFQMFIKVKLNSAYCLSKLHFLQFITQDIMLSIPSLIEKEDI